MHPITLNHVKPSLPPHPQRVRFPAAVRQAAQHRQHARRRQLVCRHISRQTAGHPAAGPQSVLAHVVRRRRPGLFARRGVDIAAIEKGERRWRWRGLATDRQIGVGADALLSDVSDAQENCVSAETAVGHR